MGAIGQCGAKSEVWTTLAKLGFLTVQWQVYSSVFVNFQTTDCAHLATTTFLGYFEPHISYITHSAARCLYGLKTLRANSLAGKSLWDVTQATLIARILYAAPAWWGFLNAAEKGRIESVINKAQRHGYLSSSFENVHSLVDNMESKLFNCILSNPRHVLYQQIDLLKRILDIACGHVPITLLCQVKWSDCVKRGLWVG